MNVVPAGRLSDEIVGCVDALPTKHSRLHSILVLAVTLIPFSQIGNAQQATMTDPSGASLPNVTITITRAESGVVKKTQTNGHSGVKAESTGFKAAEQKNVVLQVGDGRKL